MIRPATLADLPVLLALEQACFPDAWTAASLTAELLAPHQLALVALDSEQGPQDTPQIVGSLLGWLIGDELQINRVAVWPASRQRGIGHVLVRAALRQAQNRGATRALLEVRRDNLAALGLYRQHGFVSAGVRRSYYHDGCDALVLTRALADAPANALAQRLRSGLYALVDGDRLGVGQEPTDADHSRLVGYARAAVEAGAVAVQLRLKQPRLGHPIRTALLTELLPEVGDRALLVIDDDVSAVRALPDSLRRLAAVHLGQSDLPVATARALLGPDVVIGLSTHDLRQVAAARALPCDYLGFGPVHGTTGKRNPDAVTGLFAATAAAAAAQRPVVAIGGLGASDIPELAAAGVHAAAVLGGWLGPQQALHSVEQAGAALAKLCDAWRAAASDAHA